MSTGTPDDVQPSLAIAVSDESHARIRLASKPASENAELGERLRRGDPQATLLVYDKFSDDVRRVLLRLVDRHDVEDIVHDVFLEVFRSARSLEDASRLRSWIFGVTFNVARKHRRKLARTFRIFSRDPAEPELAPSNQPSSSVHAQLSFELKTALSQLTDDERFVLILRYFEDCSILEIADATQTSAATVKRRLVQAKESLLKISKSLPTLEARIASIELQGGAS